MKKYITPEVDLIKISTDILTDSKDSPTIDMNDDASDSQNPQAIFH